MQHPIDSFLETLLNVSVGYLMALVTYAVIINPLFHLHTSPSESMGIVSIFTISSVLRQYAIRRLFNGKTIYAYFKARLA